MTNAEPEEAVGVEKSRATGIQWRARNSNTLFCEEYRTSTPIALLADKLKGYIVETESQIREIEPDFVSLTVLSVDPADGNRKTHFRVDIELYQPPNQQGKQINSFVRISIFPPKARLFRRIHEDLHARIVVELRRYLMITDENAAVRLNPAATESGRDEN